MEHVLAVFRLAENIPLPKVNGIGSGYFPHHKFDNIPYLVSGKHHYDDDCLHYPGESIMTTITFVSWEFIGHMIKSGDRFEVREMSKIIGYGTVINVLNEGR
ncbi:hypothetical protein CHU32_03205 [Superficieibacter electus]|uniref:Elongation factor Tu n=1 Tax=Superficieibacter electus TaxID=2022662 RepID=A0A2P5GV65_9ENTR|nr:hypothetical protein [Superficieibacter electus]POP44429.1 hypothetical protein CHU33_13315 [Superficieibacter electus]POP50447.1 hypothetical protein CHU32_03205 [Superficieibacter electus]